MDDRTLLSWIERGQNVAALFVAIGVAAEFLLGFMAGPARRRVDQAKEAEILRLTSQSAALVRQAAELHEKAEAEQAARVKIEAAVAWRSLSDQQKREIGIAVSGFNKAGANIWFDASSTEAEMFADDIADALRLGHVTTTAPGGIAHMREGGAWNASVKRAETGVIVQSTKAALAIQFADALIKELNIRGFDAKRRTNPPFEDKPEPVIWVNVESRPKGPQGEFKLQAEREAKTKKQNTTSLTTKQ